MSRNRPADVTAEQVRELLAYDPLTGAMTRKATGLPIGTIAANGYVMVRLLGKVRLAHRLAWLLTHGSFPTYSIDHINGQRADNRLANLRDVPHAANLRNRRGRPLLVGAVPAENGRWTSAVHRYGVADPIGEFATPGEANDAWLAAKKWVNDPEKPAPKVRLLVNSVSRRRPC